MQRHQARRMPSVHIEHQNQHRRSNDQKIEHAASTSLPHAFCTYRAPERRMQDMPKGRALQIRPVQRKQTATIGQATQHHSMVCTAIALQLEESEHAASTSLPHAFCAYRAQEGRMQGMPKGRALHISPMRRKQTATIGQATHHHSMVCTATALQLEQALP